MFYRRKDAKLIDRKIPIFNRMIPYLMRGRNESIITLKERITVTETLKFTKEHSQYSYFDILVTAMIKTINKYPHLNRFIMDGHYYQRNRVSCAFVIKTKLTLDSPERNVIIWPEDIDKLDDITKMVKDGIRKAKSVEEDEQEKVIKILFKFPTFIIKWVTALIIKMDRWGILPLDFTDFDALHSSVFMANLGSIGINDAPAHHLFEWGTCSIFITSAKIRKEQVIDRDGNIRVEDILNVCFSIDERISDGFYYSKAIKYFKKLVEHPEMLL